MSSSDSKISILDHPAVSGCYLFPQDRFVKAPFLVNVPGAVLVCARNIIDPSWLTLVHFHGNGEAVADYVPWMAREFSALGLNSLFVEYREYGRSTGRAQLAAMLGDGEAVIAAAGLAPDAWPGHPHPGVHHPPAQPPYRHRHAGHGRGH